MLLMRSSGDDDYIMKYADSESVNEKKQLFCINILENESKSLSPHVGSKSACYVKAVKDYSEWR